MFSLFIPAYSRALPLPASHSAAVAASAVAASASPASTSGPSTLGFVVKPVGLVATAALAAGAGPCWLILPFTSIFWMEGAGARVPVWAR
jgi:hypothetical protein